MANLVRLTDLQFGENYRITDITPLARLTGLQTLWLSDNLIADITPLANLWALTRVELASNTITDLAPLVANPGLLAGGSIQVRGNAIDCLAQASNIAQLLARGVALQTSCP